ncbi:MAG: N-formylglutamate amidohydrolase [Rhizobiales bacterium]|nr:N-formylglutamate amidohydrolase [Hyphomicrobiales bacterium]
MHFIQRQTYTYTENNHRINKILNKRNLKTALISLELANQPSKLSANKLADSIIPNNNSAFLFSFPHSGRQYPINFVAKSRLDILNLRSSEDAYVDELFSNISQNGGNKLVALFPRAYVDVNRYENELDAELFIEQIGRTAIYNSPLAKAGYGVIARCVANQQYIYNGRISLQVAERRLESHYRPYHALINKLTQSAVDIFGCSLLIDCHSMPSKFSINQAAPDFIIGDLCGKSCSSYVRNVAGQYLSNLGFNVKFNIPYAGGAITQKYHNTQLGFHSFQLEINRGLYMNEQNLEKTKDFENIQNIMNGLAREITYIKPQALIPLHNIAE